MRNLTLAAILFCAGCAPITATVNFSKGEYGSSKVSGQAKVRAGKVQEFRSLLEALEYRETEKAK